METFFNLRQVGVQTKIKDLYTSGGSLAEWFRAQDLKSEGHWFRSSTLRLSGIVLGSPEFNSSTALGK